MTHFIVVEDTQADRDLMIEAVRGTRFEQALYFARYGVEVLEFLGAPASETSCSGVILDIELPDGDGRELLRGLRAEMSLRRLPVVIFTGRPDLREQCLRHGANDFVPKPFTFREFRRAFLGALEKCLADAATLTGRDAAARQRRPEAA